MSEHPEALRLADALTNRHGVESFEGDAANELRRLHEAHDWQYTMAGERLRRIEKLEDQNHALLEALKQISAIEDLEWGGDWEEIDQAREIANAAIKKVEATE
jgi:dsDNA-specific endonuclease/ATPase MutS2